MAVYINKWTPPRKSGGILRVSTRFSLSVGNEQAYAGREGRTRVARPNSQARTGTGNIHFPCSADHEPDWQPTCPADPYSAIIICDDHTGRQQHALIADLICALQSTFNHRVVHTLHTAVYMYCVEWQGTDGTTGRDHCDTPFVVVFQLKNRVMCVLFSACPFHTNSGCGKERRILISKW